MGTQGAIDEVDIRRRIEASEVQHGLAPIVRPGVLRHNNNCQSLTLRTSTSSDFLAIIRRPEAVRGFLRCPARVAVGNRSRQGDGL